MKHTLQKITILMVICLSILTSCQNDDFKNVTNSKNFSKKSNLYSEITLEEFQSYPTAYEAFQQLFNSSDNNFLKTTQKGNDGEDYYFDSDVIRLYEFKDDVTEYKTFVFPISRDKPTVYYENLVIWENAYGEISSWIFEYDLNENDINLLSEGKSIEDLPLKFRAKTTEPDAPVYLHEYGIWLRPDGTCFVYDRHGEIPHDCPENVTSLVLTLFGQGGGGNPVPPGGGSGGGSTSPGLNVFFVYLAPALPGGGANISPVGSIPAPPGMGGGPRVSTPVGPFINLIEVRLNNELTSNEKLFLSNNSDLNDTIHEFLNEGNLGNDGISLVKSIIQFAIENGVADAEKILDYLIEKSPINQNDRDFIEWALGYLNNNSNVTWNRIYDMFFKSYPETGDTTNIINPDNITYDTPLTQQALPNLSDFTNSFPKNGTTGNYSQMSASDVYNLVGGSLLYSYNNDATGDYGNACSIRGSRGLLYSGITIPVLNYNGSQRTQKGGDLKNYILDAVSFDKFMADKFGETSDKLEGTSANNPQQVTDLLNGKNGIYVIINNSPSQAGYSGHVDLILNGECIGGEYLSPSGGVKSIRIWTLN